MTTNSIIQILDFQNQVTALEKRLEPFIEANPLDPEVVGMRLELARMQGQLEARLEIAEIISRN